MGGLQILVEAIPLCNELLLPLAEPLLLDLDLLGETLAQVLLFFLELGVVQLPGAGLAEFAGFHLLCAVGLVVLLFGSVDEIEHVGADQNRAELLEIAVILVLNFGNTPSVLTTLNDPVVGSLDVLLGSDNSERHGSREGARVSSGMLIVLLDGRGVDLDALGLDDSTNLIGSPVVNFHSSAREYG